MWWCLGRAAASRRPPRPPPPHPAASARASSRVAAPPPKAACRRWPYRLPASCEARVPDVQPTLWPPPRAACCDSLRRPLGREPQLLPMSVGAGPPLSHAWCPTYARRTSRSTPWRAGNGAPSRWRLCCYQAPIAHSPTPATRGCLPGCWRRLLRQSDSPLASTQPGRAPGSEGGRPGCPCRAPAAACARARLVSQRTSKWRVARTPVPAPGAGCIGWLLCLCCLRWQRCFVLCCRAKRGSRALTCE